jgi:tetratricopeptide (TPR) repeat protein
MKGLGPPESFFLSFAEGWLGLGLCEDGLRELGRLPTSLRRRPEVLELQWRLQSGLGRWTECRQTARQLVSIFPKRRQGWILLAYAARRSPGRGLETAKKILLKAVKKFPREMMIPYNLACYDCQLGLREECHRWLAEALDRAPREDGGKAFFTMALCDPDLEAVRPRILEMARVPGAWFGPLLHRRKKPGLSLPEPGSSQ